MNELAVSREDLLSHCQWEATGRSPANSPAAVIQSAMALAQFAADPRSGINIYELVAAIVANGPLANSRVQSPREEMYGLAGMVPGVNPGGAANMGFDPGGGMPPGLPPVA